MYNLLSDEAPWGVSEGFSLDIDFCIWVLEVDGLQVPPFNKHPDGNRVLRAKGMEAKSWKTWVKTVALLLDQRLNWHVEDIETSLEESQESFDRMASNAAMGDIDRSQQRMGLASYYTWKEQQYQQAIAAAREVYSGSDLTWGAQVPPELWNGSPAVKVALKELWQQYLSIGCKEREWSRDSTTDKFWKVLKPYATKIPALELHFVAYPAAVEYVVPPVSAILSFTNRPPENDVLKESVLRAVEVLAQFNR
ncbi:MAG: hypothetical protein QNJ54_01410 [Prochloraceae cyanobacterium]|nr:hypothetical protein [Prochloraceae cyanobacterium]